MPTPGPPATAGRRRGSLLKVRFDVETDTASEAGAEPSPSRGATTSKQVNGDASMSAITVESSIEPPPTPPSMRERIRKKSPGIRVLDAYGREQIEPEPPKEEIREPSLALLQPPQPATPRNNVLVKSERTPRNQSTVRILDAMGREIQEEPTPPAQTTHDSFDAMPLSRKEALGRMQDTLATMRQELSDADRYAKRALVDKVFVI